MGLDRQRSVVVGATLQAPLAALTAILELTANPNIILPGMLALITAGLISRELFGMDSVYQVLLRARGLDYHHNPLTQALHRPAARFGSRPGSGA